MTASTRTDQLTVAFLDLTWGTGQYLAQVLRWLPYWLYCSDRTAPRGSVGDFSLALRCSAQDCRPEEIRTKEPWGRPENRLRSSQ